MQLRTVDRFSGSSAAFFLRAERGKFTQTVSAAQLLVRSGLTPSQALTVVERLFDVGSTAMDLPSAPDDLAKRLAPLGIRAVRREAGKVDVAIIRDKLRMTQEEFAAAFGLTAATVRNWEQHRSEPDAAARAFLKVIDLHPDIAAEAVTV